MTLFDQEKTIFKFTDRPIRLFESFSGIGCQAMALKRLGVEIEHVGISEIDKYALASYKAIHGDVKNYGDIMKIDGSTLPQIDLFTWSFPCTDLSQAGKQKGLEGGTRSGLGYEVIRIISEMKVKPTVLVMENVPDLLSEKFKDGWRKMYRGIENLGYTNYVETLNAKNYGVAQNRDRVFMVSILGDYAYEFPRGVKLEKRLKDYLEENVDEKYYLSDDKVIHINKTGIKRREYIQYDGKFEQLCRVWIKISPTLHTNTKDIIVMDKNGKYRHMTGLESFRLMGISDEDFYKAQAVVSNSQLYKQAGNGIVVDVLEAIFKEVIE